MTTSSNLRLNNRPGSLEQAWPVVRKQYRAAARAANVRRTAKARALKSGAFTAQLIVVGHKGLCVGELADLRDSLHNLTMRMTVPHL